MNPKIIAALTSAQRTLESTYQLSVPARASEFSSVEHAVRNLGTVLVRHEAPNDDLEMSLLLDRDYFSATLPELSGHHYSVIFEEVSHFFCLGVHHLRGRPVSNLELEAQSEIDRLLCARADGDEALTTYLRSKLFYETYPDPVHEKARRLAVAFLEKLSSTHPQRWRARDVERLHQFFNADLAQKFSLARYY